MKPLAPKFAPRKKVPGKITGLQCVLCPSRDATARALYKGAVLCDRCSRNQTLGSVARLFFNAAGRFVASGDWKRLL